MAVTMYPIAKPLSKKMHYIKHYFQSLIIAWWNNLVCLVGHCIVLILSELVYLF